MLQSKMDGVNNQKLGFRIKNGWSQQSKTRIQQTAAPILTGSKKDQLWEAV
jgi:hypothetical protein